MELRDAQYGRESFGTVSRRSLLKGAAVLAAAPLTPVMADKDDHPHGPIFAYVGSYTPNGQGIYLFNMDPSNGTLTQMKVAAAVPSPSWIAIHPQAGISTR